MSEFEHHHESWGHGAHHSRRMRWHKLNIFAKVGLIVAGILVAIGLFILCGIVVSALWNWLMPAIFRLPTIDFWQAWGLLLLSSILFKGGHGSHRMGSDYRRRAKLRDKMEHARERMDADQGDQAKPTDSFV